ncbi:DUF2804 domain-containing protein [Rathayibacter sp. CAU 1779]
MTAEGVLTPEHELTAPVDLCLPNGRLNPAALGWTRHQQHDTGGVASRPGRGRMPYAWGRNKRWEYWALTSPTHIVALTVSALDYAALHEVWVLHRPTLTEIDRVVVSPLGGSVELPPTFTTGPARATAKGLSIAIDEVAGGTALRAQTDRVLLEATALRPAGHEAMGVAAAWNDRLIQYTVKDVARPVIGSLTVDGSEYPFPDGESWAVLDHGRGRWPYRVSWNWGAASGSVDGRRIGLQLGGEWLPNRGPTEHSFSVDGRINKLAGVLHWEFDASNHLAPWRITGDRADLEFTPFYDRNARTNYVVAASSTHQCFGHYSGWMVDDAGARVRIDGLLGWAEDVHNRW